MSYDTDRRPIGAPADSPGVPRPVEPPRTGTSDPGTIIELLYKLCVKFI